MNIFAFTPPGNSHPPYLSINEDENKGISLTVRQGEALSFALAKIEIPLDELVVMHRELGNYLKNRSLI